MVDSSFDVRRCGYEALDDAFDLRWRILRKPCNEPRGSEQDHHERRFGTIHGAAFHNGILVATGRIHVPEERPEALQVRYMATEQTFQRKGLAGAVLCFMEQEALRTHGPREVFLHAREDAIGLYGKFGYEASAEPAFVAHGVSHIAMQKMLLLPSE